jgi:uncharacterized lipoprotein YajG
MKPYGLYLFKLGAVLAVSVIMLAGCTHAIKSDEISSLRTGSPLKSVRPRTFAFKEFVDVRGNDAFVVAKGGGHKWKLDQPVATVVATAIRKELERNGHTCVMDSPQSKSDFIIEGSVYKFWISTGGGGFASHTVIVRANVAVKLTVGPVSPEKGALTKSYEGEYQLAAFYISLETRKDILNQALLAMVKQMSTDPELIALVGK